jgi:hypothetical protein
MGRRVDKKIILKKTIEDVKDIFCVSGVMATDIYLSRN